MQNNLQALIATGTLGLVIGGSGVAYAGPGDGRYSDHYGMMGGGGWFYGPIMMLLFFALLVGAVVLVVRLLRADATRSSTTAEDHAQAILRERFAKGEISQDEYEAAKKVLDGGKP